MAAENFDNNGATSQETIDSRLVEARERINTIDEEIVRLVSERGIIAGQVRDIKKERGIPILLSRREGEVLTHVHEINEGPLSDEQLSTIFLAIMEVSRQIQRGQDGSERRPIRDPATVMLGNGALRGW